MKNLFLATLAIVLVVGFASSSRAEGDLRMGVAVDVLLPMGDFGDVVSTGFGGTAWVEYPMSPEFSLLGNIGYYTWGGEDFTVPSPFGGTTTVSGGDFSGLSIRGGGKYYFMPEGKTRVYGLGEIGLFFASVEFAFAPGIGVEVPISDDLTFDGSARYDVIATTGTTASSIGLRLGLLFGL